MSEALIDYIYESIPKVDGLAPATRGRPSAVPFNVSAFCAAMWGTTDKTRWEAILKKPGDIKLCDLLKLSEILNEKSLTHMLTKIEIRAEEKQRHAHPKNIPASA